MLPRITVRILPSSSTTRVLVTWGQDEVLKARLPAPSQMHPLAAKTLLESIALLYQTRVRVVLSQSVRLL